MRAMQNRMMSAVMFTVTFSVMAVCAQAEEVTVTVTVQTAAGEPIPDALIEAGSDLDVDFDFTDETGEVVFTIQVDPQNDPHIMARRWDGAYHFDLTPDESVLASAQYEALPKMYHFKPEYFVQTVPGQAQYQIDIVAQPSVQATGRLVVAPGVPFEEFFDIWVRGSVWHGEFIETDGLFTVYSIPQDQAAELWLGASTPETQVMQLTPAQTAQNIALGDVTVQIHERPIPLDMTMTNADDLYDKGDIDLWTMTSLIRSDAEVLLTFPVKPPDGEVVAEVVSIQTDVPRTTEGEYYVVPGPINSPTALALLDAIRAGQQAQLDAVGVPKFTAVEGQTTQFTLDAKAARDAILAATGGP